MWNVDTQWAPEKAEMVACLRRGFRNNWHVQAAPNNLGDPSDRHALVADPVIPGSRGTPLKHQPVEMRSIQPVHRRPAVLPITHIRRNTPLPRDSDDPWNEALIAVTMNRRRKPYHGHTHAPRRHRSRGLFRCHSRMR